MYYEKNCTIRVIKQSLKSQWASLPESLLTHFDQIFSVWLKAAPPSQPYCTNLVKRYYNSLREALTITGHSYHCYHRTINLLIKATSTKSHNYVQLANVVNHYFS